MKMKNILVIMICMMGSVSAKAQTNPAAELANKTAQKMSDTLGLSAAQQSGVYNLNMQLHNQKMLMRQQFAGDSILREKIQAVENRRDSLYMTVLTAQQFNVYRQKKRALLSNQ